MILGGAKLRPYIYGIKIKNMSILKFSDGEEFDTSGPLRTEERADGWYVLGNNIMVPVAGREEGNRLIETLDKRMITTK
jgi:hypothetical protein